MPNLGLSARLCPKCGLREAHRTLYVKTESGGKSKWLRIFWACTKCGSLNHVILPIYRLEFIPLELPSPLVACTVETLQQRPKSLDEVVQGMKGNCRGVRHVFTREVRMALEYLRRRGIVTEQRDDLTERILAEIRARQVSSNHLKLCPAEAEKGVKKKGLVSVYAQHRLRVNEGDGPTHTGKLRLTPLGVLCVSCGYRRMDLA